MRNGIRYGSLYERIVANTDDPPNGQSCWNWSAKKDRSYYGRVNIYVPGLGRKVILMSHVVMWLVVTQRVVSVDEMYLMYLELRCSGLEVDHLCHNATCCNPEHMDNRPLTPSENCQRRRTKRY